MADAKTIEDLAMSLVEEHHPQLYREKILPVRDSVLKVVERYLALKNSGWSYGTRFKEDIKLDSLEGRDLVLLLEKRFSTDIPDEAAGEMHSIYLTVIYLVGETKDGEATKKLAESYRKAVALIQESVMAEVGNSSEEAKYGIDTPFTEIGGLDTIKLANSLNEKMICDDKTTKRLLQGTPYDVIAYLAKRDVKL